LPALRLLGWNGSFQRDGRHESGLYYSKDMAKGVETLFAAPLEEFISARNALVKELRKSGQEEEAKRIAALRKPHKSLWLLNQLALRAPKELHALLDATKRMLEAQQKGVEVREAMQAHREALAALIAAEPEADRDRLNAAAMSDPEALREGRLLIEAQPAGFETLLAAGVSPPPKTKSVASAPPAAKPSPEEKKRQKELQAALEEHEKLAARADALEKAAAEAEQAAARVRADARAARDHAAAALDRVKSLKR
jgi:hypothetical protein